MPLSGDAKKDYQREYMRRRRAGLRSTASASSRATGTTEPEQAEPETPAAPISLAELRAGIGGSPFYYGMQQYRDALRFILADKIEPLMFCGGAPGIGKT